MLLGHSGLETPPPISISLPFGDAIHNLRSALDIAVIDAVRLNKKNTKNVRFPFANSKETLSKQLKESYIKKAGADVANFIKQVRPYPGGNDGLYELHILDIVDKHRMLVPTASSSTIDLSRLSTEANSTTRTQLANWKTGVIDGQMAVAMPLAWSPKIGTNINAKYTLGFHIPEHHNGYDILDYLREIKGIVKSIVEAIEAISNRSSSYELQADGRFKVTKIEDS